MSIVDTATRIARDLHPGIDRLSVDSVELSGSTATVHISADVSKAPDEIRSEAGTVTVIEGDPVLARRIGRELKRHKPAG